MKRVLEPEVMDTQQDAEEYDAMDFTEADTRFAEDALFLLKNRANPRVLDVGTGTAKIPVLMLGRGAHLEILAVDLAREMLKVAERRIRDAGFEKKCTLACMDAKALDVGDGEFDLVVCNSTVHHVPDPAPLFREIARVVKPNGAILIRDLVRPETEGDAWTIVRRVSAGDTPHQQKLFFDSLCAALTQCEVEELVRKCALDRASVRLSSDRHWSCERAASP